MTLPDLPPIDLCPESLAHRLALQTRWCGATEKPFTLAQHAALTYDAFLRLAPARGGEAIHALLAAVPEALVGGLPTPTMRHLSPRVPDLRAALDALHADFAEAVRRRHGLAAPSPEAVAMIDAARIVASAIAWRCAMPPGYGPSPYGTAPRHAAAIPILAWPAAEDLVLHLIRLELAGHRQGGREVQAAHGARPRISEVKGERLMTIKHDACVFWPNGAGETPCSREYLDKLEARDAIKARYSDIADDQGFVPLEALEAADYEAFCRLDNELGVLQLTGHLGRGVRY